MASTSRYKLLLAESQRVEWRASRSTRAIPLKLMFMYLLLAHGSDRSFHSWHPALLRRARKSFFSALQLATCAFKKSTCQHGSTGTRPSVCRGNHWRGFKIADDTRGPVIDPSTMERKVSEEKLSAARADLRLRFPEIADAPLLESRVCQYEKFCDDNFILDRHPEVRTSGSLAEVQDMVSNMVL